MSFKDHFSGHSSDYARHRPTYPDALFSYLRDRCRFRNHALDCATGSGQAAHGLTPYFREITAIDASMEQLEAALPHSKITYKQAPAEKIPIREVSVDLVTVAQALHWFDFDCFYAEAARVLKPKGVIAIWAYEMTRVSPEIDLILNHFYNQTVGPFWPPERAYVENQYKDIPFPFKAFAAPTFSMMKHWNLTQLLAYLSTWSAVRRYMQSGKEDPIPALRDMLLPYWGAEDNERLITWPLMMKIGSA